MRVGREPVTFAVVGFGHIGRRHAVFIEGHPDCRLVGICDSLPSEELVGREVFEVPHFRSMEEMLMGVECEVVCICTPNGMHAEQALWALDAGRHVVVEKPMALKRSDCERIIHRALNRSRQVFCVMQNRYSPAVRWLKDAVEGGILGDIRMLEMHCFWNRDERYYRPGGKAHAWHGSSELDGGVLFTQFAHFIDILYWVFGELDEIRSRFVESSGKVGSDLADSGVVSFRLEGGGLGSLAFSTAVYRQNFESSITVIGENGTVKIGGQYMDRLAYCDVENMETPHLPPVKQSVQYPGYEGAAANHHFVFQNVVEVLRGQSVSATTNALEGMKTVDIIERMYKAG